MIRTNVLRLEAAMSFMKRFYDRHPRLVMWAALGVGMVIILAISVPAGEFDGGQWAALIATVIGLAGLCVWIIGWEDEEETEENDEAGEKEAA